ncbi:Deoxyribose-phosphate aldolase 1 [Jeotgalibaca dankookensis]|uniref:Deoxyribose-phosphate aldolase n=1 Tax=Jeotgalibaca dankookensis TaxID=708126 RepID=A0A1S6IP19_9LACT|nr:deoxyribose-phosphate aldolase [Jeotgalibaca dankookensis]AQS53269.1 Deoxyribose-phosphate aldolase 1 [Jeotgalibaca dankookensis]
MTKINKYIDHTLLKPEATEKEIHDLCEEAIEYDFMSVCVQPYWVSKVSAFLNDTDVKVCTVVGFPHGANTKEVKAFEAKQAVQKGADEVDMVINIGAAKEGKFDTIREEISAVAEAVKGQALLKVILETALLTDDEIISVSEAAKAAGADFVKTSTGFSTGGATLADVSLMRQTVGPDMGVKASGGVRTYADALAFIEAGATRLGASSGKAIVDEWEASQN